jgi:hypothetical protein
MLVIFCAAEQLLASQDPLSHLVSYIWPVGLEEFQIKVRANDLVFIVVFEYVSFIL